MGTRKLKQLSSTIFHLKIQKPKKKYFFRNKIAKN